MSTGLVLNGGGGKGAYQIGVWKYLREKKIEFDYISGTSAGGLNAALIALNDLNKAVDIWLKLKPGDVRKVDSKQILNILKLLAKELIELFALRRSTKSVSLVREFVRRIGYLNKTKNVLTILIQQGVFSTEPLKQLINSHIDFTKFPKKPNIYITVVKNHPLLIFEDKQYINFTSYNHVLKEKMLIATSAIPLIFPTTNIGNIHYSDGGIPIIGDNSPISPIYFRGCKDLYVVHTHKEGKTVKNKFHRANIVDISPKSDLGSFLKIEGEYSRKLIDLGYKDAKEMIG
ncbi:patatin-like phospholipase family protein [Desulfobacterota bacterium AH_259_B03_O07]|nr:patatin-like phospholipase family protein [Desulfobacterota bacterium AH_259_B03_O07]